jgi:hypothetical protein
MYKRFRLWQVIQQLNLQGISILLFQQVVKTPAGGYSIKIKMRVGMTPTKFLKKSEAIAVALKAAEVELERIRGNKFRVIVRKQVEKILPQYPANASQPLIPMPLNYVPIGVNADGYPVGLPLFNSSGGTVTLIAGNPGQGKSSALKIILAGCVNSNASIIWFDPKSGADANPYKDRVEVVSDPRNPGQFLDYLVRIQELIFQRNQIISQGFEINALPRVVLFIDEWALLAALGTKQEQQLIQTEIRNLAATGRSANISLVLATQRPTSVNIDVATRELSNNRVAFLVGDTHASEAILGQTGAESKTNPLSPGQALVWLDGQLQRTTIYQVPEQLTTWCKNAAGYKITLQDAEELGEIFSRECGIKEF